MRVLVPSAGRRYLAIQNLKDVPGVERVVTTEINGYAPGIHAADACYNVPRVGHPEFLDDIMEICRKEGITLVVPLMDLDILFFSRNRRTFEEQDISVLLSPPETIETVADKLETAKMLRARGLSAPSTFSLTNCAELVDKVGFPLLIKPRYTATKSSRIYSITVIDNENDLNSTLRDIFPYAESFVIQEYLPGTELTVDFFCDQHGTVRSVVPGERLSALTTAFSRDGGAIDRGRTFHDPQIDQLVACLTAVLPFFGPANFQGFRDRYGAIRITEINPRFTGATVMTKGAGRDHYRMSIELVLGRDVYVESDFNDVYMTSWVKPIFSKTLPCLADARDSGA